MPDGHPVEDEVPDGGGLVAVIGQDAVIGQLEGAAQVRGDGLPGGGDVVGGHGGAVEGDAVESAGELPHGGVATGPHLVENGPHLGRRKALLGHGRGTAAATPAAGTPRRSSRVRSTGTRWYSGVLAHRPSRRPPETAPCIGRGRRGVPMGHHRVMPAPLAELSSVATALDELTRRVVTIADQAASDHDDETAVELFAVERALKGAGRRLERLTAFRARRS